MFRNALFEYRLNMDRGLFYETYTMGEAVLDANKHDVLFYCFTSFYLTNYM